MTTPNESNKGQTQKKNWVTKCITGEWGWEKWVFFVLGFVCLADALIEAFPVQSPTDAVRAFIRDGALHTALLFIVLFYLSEMRYRFFEDVRND